MIFVDLSAILYMKLNYFYNFCGFIQQHLQFRAQCFQEGARQQFA